MIEIRTTEYRRASFALALGSFLIFCNLYLFQSMLPLLAETFSVSATKVNWLLAAGILSLAVTLVPWAIASEVIGRRQILLFSLLLSSGVGFLMMFADSFLLLTIARAALGVALAGFTAVAVGYMAEEFSPEALMLAVGGYISANSLGGITGRLYGGFVGQHWDWQTAVLGLAIATLLGSIAVQYLLPKQKHFKAQKYQFRAHNKVVVKHFLQPKLRLAMFIGGINFALFINIFTITGFRLVAPPFSMPLSLASMIFLCYLSGTLTAKLSGRWTQHYNPITGMILGNIVSAIGMRLTAYDHLYVILLGLIVISSGAFFTHSLAYAWVSHHAVSAKATATALYLMHYYVGGSLGGFYLIACWQYGELIGVLSGAMVLYAVVHLLCVRLKKYSLLNQKQVSARLLKEER